MTDRDNTVETVSVRLNQKAKEMLDVYHSKRPALSRGACFVQMLYDIAWQAEENGKTARIKRLEEWSLLFEGSVNQQFSEVISRLDRIETAIHKGEVQP